MNEGGYPLKNYNAQSVILQQKHCCTHLKEITPFLICSKPGMSSVSCFLFYVQI